MADSKPMPPISVKKSRSTNPADEDMVDIEHASLAATTKYLEELLEKKNADGRHVAACKSTPLGAHHQNGTGNRPQVLRNEGEVRAHSLAGSQTGS
jgi:hypothetical protein